MVNGYHEEARSLASRLVLRHPTETKYAELHLRTYSDLRLHEESLVPGEIVAHSRSAAASSIEAHADNLIILDRHEMAESLLQPVKKLNRRGLRQRMHYRYYVLETHRPQSFVFDGAFPYRGMLDALATIDVPQKVWVRRGMFRKGTSVPVDAIGRFDLIVHPGDAVPHAASEVDHGVEELHVPPMLLIDPEEMWSRDTARRRLGPRDGRSESPLHRAGGGSAES